MATNFFPPTSISISKQAYKLKKYFPYSNCNIINKGTILIWNGNIKPSELSLEYSIKINYKRNQHPNVYIISPFPLKLPKDEKKLKHVYSHEKQHLCLYYRNINEWNSTMYIADTVIPWTSEWLLHYEYWLATDGIWNGGGIEH
ncbi:hypothetical protein GFV01_00840 [Apibacter sp. B2912]|nr:hypothetical protein [Apibacter sp. B2912]